MGGGPGMAVGAYSSLGAYFNKYGIWICGYFGGAFIKISKVVFSFNVVDNNIGAEKFPNNCDNYVYRVGSTKQEDSKWLIVYLSFIY